VAKTVADGFKFRNRIGLAVAIEALREGWQQRALHVGRVGCHGAHLPRAGGDTPLCGGAGGMKEKTHIATSIRQRLRCAHNTLLARHHITAVSKKCHVCGGER